MAYMTIPNSFTSGGTVTAEDLNTNFAAIQTGLMCGNVDFNINRLKAGSVTVAGDAAFTSITVSGEDHGTRHLFPLIHFYQLAFGDQGDGYIAHINNTDTDSNTEHLALPYSGSVTGYSYYFYPTTPAVGTATLALVCSGTTFASAEFDLNGGEQKIYSVITRGVYSFVSQAKVAAYYTEINSAAAQGHMTVMMEVVYD